MQKIIAFAGPAGVGKDECGKHLIAKFGFTKLAWAQWLKAMLTAIGYPEPPNAAAKEEIIPLLGVSWRTMAQTLGTEWGRNMVHDDIWVLLSGEYMQKNPLGNFVITDLRFENEATKVRELGGTIVHLRGRRAAMAAATAGHVSEKGVAVHASDIVIHNDTDGIPLLHSKLELALRSIL